MSDDITNSADDEESLDDALLWELTRPIREAAAKAVNAATLLYQARPVDFQVPDRFEIVAELGHGGMGSVYQVRDRLLGQIFAVKVTHPSLAARLQEEARAISQLDHPYIARLYEVLEWDGRPVLKMEFVPGENLAIRIGRQGPMDDLAAAALVERLSLAIQHAHQRNVLHRDLKPENVLLVNDSWEPKIIDFGLARLLHRHQRLTEHGVVMGTKGYMPPEQARGDPEVGPTADIHALGGILYYCLIGRPPSSSGHFADTPTSNDERSATSAEDLRRCHPDLTAICLKCLADHPADRFQTASELSSALEAMQNKNQWTRRFLLGLAGASLIGLTVWGFGFRSPEPSRQEAITKSLEATRQRYDALLRDIRQVPENDRAPFRYVWISPDASPRQADRLRRILSAWRFDATPIATEVPSMPSLYRLNLALITKRPRDYWDDLLSGYPFGLRHQEQADLELRRVERELQKELPTLVPCIHADWLVRRIAEAGPRFTGVDHPVLLPQEGTDFATEWNQSRIHSQQIAALLGMSVETLRELADDSDALRADWQALESQAEEMPRSRWESMRNGASLFQRLNRELLGLTPIDL